MELVIAVGNCRSPKASLVDRQGERFPNWLDASEELSMSLPSDFDLKEQVRAAVDIVDVVGRTLELRPQGRNYVALCPWHDDRKPSLSVNPQRQTWKCWPCDIGGDVFSFVMRRDGVDFLDSLKILGEYAGIDVSAKMGRAQAEPGSPNDRATLLAAVQFASDAMFERLESARDRATEAARRYLETRGIDDATRRLFRIGFAPDEWSWLLDAAKRKGFRADVMQAAGLARARSNGTGHYDFFRGRVIFPIFDLQDRPIALGGRIVPELVREDAGDPAPAKYFNGPETRLYSKSRELYGLNLARHAVAKQREVFVMEGYTDVVAARQAGIEPVVAVLGTALGEGHLRILRRFADRVVLVLDGDAAGKKRADEVLELFVGADVDLRILTLPDELDPADYLEQIGVEPFRQMAADAPDAIDHKLSRVTAGVDLTRDTHRAATAMETMLRLLAKAPAAANGLRIQQLLVRFSRTFGVATEDLRSRLDQLRKQQRQRAPQGRSRSQVSSQQTGPRQPASPSRGAGQIDPNSLLAEAGDPESERWLSGDSAARRGAAAQATPGEPAGDPGLQPILGIDRELFEIMIEDPEFAPKAIEAIDPCWLETEAARSLMQAYQDLDLEGRELNLESLLLVVDSDGLKNTIVTMEERVQRREGRLTQTPTQRYASAIERYHQMNWMAEKARQLAALSQEPRSADEEAELLRRMFEGEKVVKGLLANPKASVTDSR